MKKYIKNKCKQNTLNFGRTRCNQTVFKTIVIKLGLAWWGDLGPGRPSGSTLDLSDLGET